MREMNILVGSSNMNVGQMGFLAVKIIGIIIVFPRKIGYKP
jgi:hypothetical protein